MKKYFIIFLSLIVLFPSALAAVQIIAADDADRVIWSEQTIYGDKSELDGIEADFMLQCMEHLYWNIDLTLGENITSSADFKFVHTPKQIVTTRRNNFNIGFGFNSFGSSSNHDLLDGDNTFHGQYDMIKDIASRTPAGSKRTENVHLADYYEYYPMYLDFNIGDLHVYNDSYNDYRPTKYSALIDEIISVLEKTFRFRVSENDIQTVTVRKNADGAVVSIDSNPAEKSPRVYLESMSVVSGNAVYFTVNPVSEDGSEIGFDGEYGLYRIPYGIIEYEDKYSSGNRYSDVRINEISMVYPLNEGTDVVNISTSPDESELYLTLRKESEISLVVFDCATMSVKQNSPIFTCNSSSPVQMVDIEKDYLLYKVDFRTFALIDNHTGEWKTKSKPIVQATLGQALDAAICEVKANSFVFTADGNSHIVPMKDIFYFEVFNHHTILHTKDHEFTFRATLKEIMAELPIGYFGSPHQSYLVNFMHVQTAMTGELRLTNGAVVPVSRRKQQEFEDQLHSYLGR